jgi:hypothetical protein
VNNQVVIAPATPNKDYQLQQAVPTVVNQTQNSTNLVQNQSTLTNQALLQA